MANFRQDMQSFKPFQPFLEKDKNMEFTNHFAELNPSMLENFNITDFSVEAFLAHQQPEFPAIFAHDLPGTLYVDNLNAVPAVVHTIPFTGDVCHESKKRKVTEQSKINFDKISSTASGNELEQNDRIKKKKSLGKGKKGRSDDKEDYRSEEVIHVRARRGQATDSHSLAERVRREKINHRLRRLQNLVPGCYKAMGMAGMLDEIINYVHSLQNQVEFLSMELAAASSFHDLNMETEAIQKAQGTNAHETEDMEKMMRRAYGEHTFFHSTRPL